MGSALHTVLLSLWSSAQVASIVYVSYLTIHYDLYLLFFHHLTWDHGSRTGKTHLRFMYPSFYTKWWRNVPLVSSKLPTMGEGFQGWFVLIRWVGIINEINNIILFVKVAQIEWMDEWFTPLKDINCWEKTLEILYKYTWFFRLLNLSWHTYLTWEGP